MGLIRYKNSKLGEGTHWLLDEFINEHLSDLIKIYNSLTFILTNLSDNFDGIQFCDNFSGIAIHLYHKKLSNEIGDYPITAEIYPHLKYDCSNISEVIETAINFWEDSDEDEGYINYLINSYNFDFDNDEDYYIDDDYDDFDTFI